MEEFFDKLHEEQPGVYGFYNNQAPPSCSYLARELAKTNEEAPKNANSEAYE